MKQQSKLLGSLEKAILDLHGCKFNWSKSVPVKETFKGETVWEGTVEVSDLQGHPTANRDMPGPVKLIIQKTGNSTRF
jgi:hypothetical protein